MVCRDLEIPPTRELNASVCILYWTSIRLYVILNTKVVKHTEDIMKNITEMNSTEFRELLHTLVNEELFKSQ